MRAKSRENPSALAKWWGNHRKDALNSLFRLLLSPLSSAMTVIVIAAALLLPSLLFSFNANITTLLEEFQNNARIILYLHSGTSSARGIEVGNSLLTYNDIDNAEFVSNEDALRSFSSAAGFSQVLADLETNPLPASIVITPNLAALEGLDQLAATLEQMPEVELVQVDSLWLRRLAAISDLINLAARVLGLIVLLSLCFIVGNTVRLHIENRRDEIKIIKLIGGTHSYIARPFLYTGLFYGLLGGILASLLQAAVFLSFRDSLNEIVSLYDSSFALPLLTVSTFIALAISGALIGWLAAIIAGYRHIGAISP
jgi:cell division transport system permease protein